MIKKYLEDKYGFKIHTAYIAHVKRDLELSMYDNSDAVEELNQPRNHLISEKVEAIKDLLKHYEISESNTRRNNYYDRKIFCKTIIWYI